MLNKKVLKICITLILFTLVFGIATSFCLKLDNPVFLMSYMDRDIPIFDTGYYGDVEFHLRYITNVNDTKTVNHIEFPEAPNLRGWASETGGGFFDLFSNQSQIPGRQVGTYSIRTIYIKMDAHDIPVSDDEIHLTKARVYFTNGEEMDVDLGEIVLYGYRNLGENIDFMSGSSSSDGTSSTQMKTLKDLTLLRVESPLLSKFGHLIELKINSTDYKNISEMKFNKEEGLNIFSKFNEPENIIERFNDYNIHPKLYFDDSEGNTFIHRIYNIDYQNYSFEFTDIIKYLRARGEL